MFIWRLDLSREMSKLKKGAPAKKDAEEKEENHLDRILDSPACRKLFTWARSKDADSRLIEMDKEVKEEQRLRWNFDFETETPLPGRYQWIRTDFSNGHSKNGDAVHSKVRNGQVEGKTSRQTLQTPYSRKSRTKPEVRNLRSGSCDRPRRSERNSPSSPHDLRWN